MQDGSRGTHGLQGRPDLKQHVLIATLASVLALGLTACEKKGPAEQFGEEVDEAVDTIRDGEESTANKLDDAADEVRSAAEQAAEEVRGE